MDVRVSGWKKFLDVSARSVSLLLMDYYFVANESFAIEALKELGLDRILKIYVTCELLVSSHILCYYSMIVSFLGSLTSACLSRGIYEEALLFTSTRSTDASSSSLTLAYTSFLIILATLLNWGSIGISQGALQFPYRNVALVASISVFLAIFQPSFSTLDFLNELMFMTTVFYIIRNCSLRLLDLSHNLESLSLAFWLRFFHPPFLLEYAWSILDLTFKLSVYWLFHALYCAVDFFINNPIDGNTNIEEYLIDMGKSLLTRGCNSLLTVTGMAATISYISGFIDLIFHRILMIEFDDRDRSLTKLSGTLFFLLAIQTGLVYFEPKERIMRLLMNLSLLITAILYSIHILVATVLERPIVGSNIKRKSFRALMVCAFLVLVSMILLINVREAFYANKTGLFIITIFCIEVIINVFISIVLHIIYAFDLIYDYSESETFDTVMYSVKAVGHIVEFIFAICLFIASCRMLFLEAPNFIRAIMICVHAYKNIWCRALEGYESFTRRRSLLGMIHLLAKASKEQIRQYDDVCSICLMTLGEARIANCNHFFHQKCITKYLYLRSNCPLCQGTLLFQAQNISNGAERPPLPAERSLPNAALPSPETADNGLLRDPSSSDEDELIYDALDNYDEDYDDREDR